MDIQLPQIIFQIINFGVVLAALTYLVYKPVLKLLDERKKKIADAAKLAEEVSQQKAKLNKLEEETMQKAHATAKKIEQETRKKTLTEQALLLDKSKAELSQRSTKFSAELSKLKKEELKAMETEIKQAAVLLAEKVLGQKIDAKQHQKLLDQQIDQIIESL